MKLLKKSEYVWQIEKEGKMNVPITIFASELILKKILQDKTLDQAKNMAMMSGVVKDIIVLPDAHQGYGACIGGVAAYDLQSQKGVISPGQVGYDINCGVRVLISDLTYSEVIKKRNVLIDDLFKSIPSGLGKGAGLRLSDEDLNEVLEKGVSWAVKNKYATKEDLRCIEDEGCIPGADSKLVSERAKARGRQQLGSLGSGNHFLEIQQVDQILDKKVANAFGIKKEGQIAVMIHSGSRGLGHQTASDYIYAMEKEYGFSHLPDRELACAPISSALGKQYAAAMAAAANFAFVNRQLITHKVRECFAKHFSNSKLDLIYDIAHNIAKHEKHIVNGKKVEVCVHRKGATRSFGPGRKEIPEKYREYGCPIFLPGSMGTYSYVLLGTKVAEELSFGSTAHGAGRNISRSQAIKTISIKDLEKTMKKKDIWLKAGSMKGAVEEAPEVYKDIDEVARVSHEAGLGKLVARLKPIAVIKG